MEKEGYLKELGDDLNPSSEATPRTRKRQERTDKEDVGRGATGKQRFKIVGISRSLTENR